MTAIIPRSEVSGVDAAVRLVLDGLPSPKSKAVYSTALYRFLDWRKEQGSPPFSKRLVQTYRQELLESDLAPASVNLHLSAIRKLALEAADNGLLDPNVAAAIGRVPNVTQAGRRQGHWLSKDEVKALLAQPDTATLLGLRDKAILAVLVGAGLRRAEAVSLTVSHFREVEGRWIIVDLKGKGNKLRSVPIPFWVKVAVDGWLEAAGIEEGPVFVQIRRGNHPTKDVLSDRAVYDVIARYVNEVAPHDLRRTFSKLSFKGGAPIDQISKSLGHSSIQTTERYLNIDQNLTLGEAPCDFLGLFET